MGHAGCWVYTSVLRADTSTHLVGPEHLATERNLTASLGPALQSGAIVGSAGKGRFAAAARADYAEAAAVVLTPPGHAGKIYEFGGDVGYHPRRTRLGSRQAVGQKDRLQQPSRVGLPGHP